MRQTFRELVLVSICVNMAIVAGAVSFSTRPIPISESVEIQREIWRTIHERGAGAQHPDWLVRSNSSRVLMPSLMAGLTELGLTWDRAFSLLRLLSIVAAYLAFFYYLRGWFQPDLALAGFLFMSSTIPLTFSNWHELPTDFPEFFFFSLAYCLLRAGATMWLYPLVFVSALNRETTAFIPVLALLVLFESRQPRRALCVSGSLALVWFAPYWALRWWTGVSVLGPYGNTWEHNQAGLARFIENLNPFNHYLYYLWLLGPFWLVPLMRYKALPLLLQRALLLLPVSAPVYVLFRGYLNEPRPLMHFYCLLVPAGLFAVFGVNGKADQRGVRVRKADPAERPEWPTAPPAQV